MKKAQIVIAEMIEQQKGVLLAAARRIIPDVTSDDLLQPNDFLELELHPHFRYEEGILAGMLAVQMALQAQEALSPKD